MSSSCVRILGVDTSLRSTGIGVVEVQGTSFTAVEYGVIKNPAKRIHSDCLHHLYQGILDVINRTSPDALAIEGAFYSKNVKTSMILGQARGVVMAAGASMNIPIFEYAPRRIKKALVGTGTAPKEQMIHMITRILKLQAKPTTDEADALAIAVCHLQARTSYAVMGQDPI